MPRDPALPHRSRQDGYLLAVALVEQQLRIGSVAQADVPVAERHTVRYLLEQAEADGPAQLKIVVEALSRMCASLLEDEHEADCVAAQLDGWRTWILAGEL